MTTPPPSPPILASAGLLVRDDDRILLVRHRAGRDPFAGRWSLPLAPVAGHEAAEDALQRVLRDQLGVKPGPYEFQDTLYLEGIEGSRFIVNAFTCVGWGGEPRFSAKHYDDAAWVNAAAPGNVELAGGLADWLARSFGTEALDGYSAASLQHLLAESRGGLVAAFEAVPLPQRGEPLLEGWSPIDVLAHVADVEAYYAAEAQVLLEEAGHTWRPFSEYQWKLAYRLREPEEEATLRARLERVRDETEVWLATLTPDELSRYGNHAERGAVMVGERIEKIARHYDEHADQLRVMATAGRVASASDAAAPEGGA